MKTFILDWRHPQRWTDADHKREADAASVYWMHFENPLPAVTRVLTAQSPTIYLWRDKPVAAMGAVAMHHGFHLIEGSEFEVWRNWDGSQRTIALNIARREVARFWADRIVEYYPWAGGVHIDYYTSLDWLVGLRYPDRFWQKWAGGLLAAVERMRQHRPDWKLLGQQFHRTGITDVLDGLFLEQTPTSFGYTMDRHERDMKEMSAANGRDPFWVAELGTLDRPAETYPRWYVQMVEDWCDRTGIHLSRNRDAAARGNA